MSSRRSASTKTVLIRLFFSGIIMVTTLGIIAPIQAAGVLYAAPAAAGSGTCGDWANVCTLQTALGNAVSGDQIWVKAGLYKPGAGRSDAFVLKSGVEIYGGFAGGESNLSERDWETNLTVLSGDIDNNDVTNGSGVVTGYQNVNGNNSYHVVQAGSDVTTTARLDGFVVTAGMANGSSPNYNGGGIYNDNGSPTLSNLTVIGNKATGSGGAMYNVNGGNPVLADSVINANYANYGGGMYNDASNPSLNNVVFASNQAENHGGGLYNIMSDPSFTQVDFENNTANYGGGLYNSYYSESIFINVTIRNNTASYSGGGMYNLYSNVELVNVALVGNTAGTSGGGMDNDRSSPILTNVDIVGNSAQYGGGMRTEVADPVLTNGIVWGNTASLLGDQMYTGAGDPIISYSLIQDSGGSGAAWDDDLGVDGGGNIDSDPLFVDMDGDDNVLGTDDDDLRLGPGSPAIDAGDNTAVPGSIFTDLNGAARFSNDPYIDDTGNGSAPLVDMGAYEAAWVLYAAPAAVGDGDCTTWADACTLLTAIDTAEYGNKIWVQAGLYKPGSPRTKEFDMKSGVEIYGGFVGNETRFDQRDWETYLTVLSGDIDNNDTTDPYGVVTSVGDIVGSNSYHVVYAGPGVTETAVLDGFVLTAGQAYEAGNDQFGGGILFISSSPTIKNVEIIGNKAGYGGGGVYFGEESTPTLANVQILNCSAYIGGGLFCDGSSPILTGVIIDGNQASYAGGMRNSYGSNPILSDVIFSNNKTTDLSGDGGAMFNYYSSNPILTNVMFYNNESRSSGGGIANYSSNPTLIGVYFYNNSARLRGGGINNVTSNPLMVNVLFSGNLAGINYSGGGGGGMYNSHSNPRLINATFCNNSATGAGGGIVNADSTYTMTNVIVWGNNAPGSTDDVYSSRSSITFINSIISSPDPRFVDADGPDDTAGTLDDDLRLMPDSPAIDAGDNTVVPITVTTDLDGIPRFIDIPFVADAGIGAAPIVDIGAYEAGFANLSLEKKVIPESVSPGELITFSLSLSNTGYMTASQVVLIDELPSFLQPGSVVTGGIIITDSGNQPAYTWDVQDLAPSEGGLITLTLGVTSPAASAIYTNTATASYRIYDMTVVVTGSVVYTVANTAPFFTSIPGTDGIQDSPYDYSITTEELNGEVVTITAPILPGWLALADYGNGNAFLGGTPGNAEVGQHPVVLEVTDSSGLAGSQSFTLTVANINDSPVFTSTPVTTATQDILYSYSISSTDPDLIHGDLLVISGPAIPAWLELSDHGDGTAALSGIPANADVGDHPVLLLVSDTEGLTNTQFFTITVANVNDAPMFTSEPVTAATEGSLYTYSIAATDPDIVYGDEITLTATILPEWLSMFDHGDGTALLSGTPSNDDVGDHDVLLQVADSSGLTDTQEFAIHVANLNDAPTFTSTPVITASQDTLYSYTITVNEPDLGYGDLVTITAPVIPAWLGLTDNGSGSAVLDGSPSNADVGDHRVELRVTDSGGLTDSQVFTITVANVNDSPTFTSAPVMTAMENALYTYAILADDPDLVHGDILTITTVTLPGWLELEDHGDGKAALSGTPSDADVGDHGVSIRVFDSGGLSDTQSFSITVAYINDAPIFTSSPVTTATEAMLYTYNILADDPDLVHSDVLTITAEALPRWLLLSNLGDGNATLSGTPSNEDVGEYTIDLLVTDGGSLTGTQSFTLAVLNMNNAPVFTSTPVTNATQDVLYTYGISASDPDLLHGDQLTITAQTMPGWLSLTGGAGYTTTLTGSPTNADVGDHAITLLVTDSGGLTGTQSFSITVANVNDAPFFTSTPVTSAHVDSSYNYLIAATDPDLMYGDEVLITAPKMPVWLALSYHGDGTTTLSGTPTIDNLGDHEVLLQVEDNEGLVDTQSFTITVGEKYPFRIYLPMAIKGTP